MQFSKRTTIGHHVVFFQKRLHSNTTFRASNCRCIPSKACWAEVPVPAIVKSLDLRRLGARPAPEQQIIVALN
jgi:hypothetical protein